MSTFLKKKRKNIEKSFFNIIEIKFDIMTLIRTKYSKNIIFQRIMKIKRKKNDKYSSTSLKQILNWNSTIVILKKICSE